jgi:alkylation response protein AidB-like acyl-CoA dehydrogenase
MHFDLTDEQKAIREAVEELLRDKFQESVALKAFDAAVLDTQLWGELMGLGLGSVMLSESRGGLGMGLLTLAVLAESLARFAVPAPIWQNALACWAIDSGGTPEQRERWCDALARGTSIAAFALLEPGRGWLPDNWSLAAGSKGAKACVEWGAQADLLIVGLSSGRLGLIERTAPGVHVQALGSLDKARPLADIELDARCQFAELSADGLTARVVDALLILYSADALGAGCKALEMAVDYAKQRIQFGQPIGKFQAMKHQMANLCLEIEPCRPLLWYAAHAWDTSRPDATRVAAMLKAHVSDIAVKTARMTVELHGGIGYTWEYPLHIFLKRTMASRVAMGLPAIHRERAAAMAPW